MHAISRIHTARVTKLREIKRKSTVLYTPHPPMCKITEVMLSSEHFLVLNQILTAYSLVVEDTTAHKSEASPCAIRTVAGLGFCEGGF